MTDNKSDEAKKKENDFETLAKTKLESEQYTYEAAVLKYPKVEGVAFRTSKKSKEKGEFKNRSLFIEKSQRVDLILNWVFITAKKFFAQFWNKQIITPADVEADNRVVDDLRNKLHDREEEDRQLKSAFRAQEQELALAKEVIDNSNQYSTELDLFEQMVNQSVANNENIEEVVKNELKKKRWILGLDCEVKAKNKDIDTDTEIDLHIETNFGEQRIIEAKSPNIKLFTQKTEGGRLNINPKISEGLSEIIEYMRRTDVNSGLRRKGTYEIQKPIGRILAGYELNKDEQEFINDWNFYLFPYIKFVTYKELIVNARKEIELISIVKKNDGRLRSKIKSNLSYRNFKNQGDCVSYVATKGKNPPDGSK